MNRDQPPCNMCAKHDCRSCAWTSPLDASYRTLIQSHSMLSLVALSVKSAETAPAEPSWLGIACKRILKFFSQMSPLAR
ncbi:MULTISPECIES: hypothetical protein [Caballeronia]|jgi:hypothetical protein|uniref:Uncharacterized protein n=1 Tax=Caballeronia zhejiangensis TaxID=871203 RepID=A0A656QKF0_9BURK|nr:MULTISPECIES: hypothetical protein [Caballeronia]EKS66918.1 hypothetical protein BURK_033769 [Burkholderia sp. SJ98]KDR30723.1 hypothetical protein BG60_36795 [Caballeronia zhejiangensis]MCG7402210.1 hypothetical protein [Caballeronia zhejiangensis]MCI1042383.1 hypothetical protein [Caballeronia zhejiangensis]MDR5768405.1 hypothetical protein [Caballeronia sp. LZ028]